MQGVLQIDRRMAWLLPFHGTVIAVHNELGRRLKRAVLTNPYPVHCPVTTVKGNEIRDHVRVPIVHSYIYH
jgi:hypothetical protein